MSGGSGLSRREIDLGYRTVQILLLSNVYFSSHQWHLEPLNILQVLFHILDTRYVVTICYFLQETLGVPVLSYSKTNDFPAFYTPRSGFKVTPFAFQVLYKN